jgi:outer membrane protein OmpA-like peptidoglycan-associated protein
MRVRVGTILVFALTAFSVPSALAAEAGLGVAQMAYSYCYEYARGLIAPTFLICKDAPDQPLAKTPRPRITLTASRDILKAVGKKTVYFDKDSAQLTQKARAVLDSVDVAIFVSVTGYTCPLGSAEHNRQLAEKRARAVAYYLRRRGVRVSAVQGKGGCCFVNGDPEKSRRVVIEPETSDK